MQRGKEGIPPKIPPGPILYGDTPWGCPIVIPQRDTPWSCPPLSLTLRTLATFSDHSIIATLPHANFLTSTASQGQTIRTGVTIDCARIEPKGRLGAKDSAWWLHLYVMFSRATCMDDMLILRPPPRDLLEGGPPAAVRKALERFEEKIASSVDAAAMLAAEMGILLQMSFFRSPTRRGDTGSATGLQHQSRFSPVRPSSPLGCELNDTTDRVMG